MAIPDYQACMLPLLRFAADGKEHQLKDAIGELGREFSLTEDKLREFLPSGVGDGVKLCDLWRFETVGGNLVVGSPAPA